MNQKRLQNKTLLITGAAGGLGRPLCKQAAKEGAVVVLLDKAQARLDTLFDDIVADGSPEPVLMPMDIEAADPESCEAIRDAIGEQFGALDGLIHCAARFSGLTPHEHLDPQEWLRVMQANVNGPWLLTQSLLPLLKAASAARLIFVLDSLTRVAGAHWGAYGASKHALRALSEQLRGELRNTSISVLGFNPGPMATDLYSKAYMVDPANPPGDAAESAKRLMTLLTSVDNPPAFVDLEDR